MSRFLTVFNLLGIGALCVLCVLQWRDNSRLNHELAQLEQIRAEQAARIAEQDRTIQGYVADLQELRGRLTLAETALRDTERKLNVATQENHRLTAERDQLKSALDKWTAAFTASEKVVKQLNDLVKKLISQRDVIIRQFNDLAVKYNSLVNPGTRPAASP